jgi:Ser/Thr protein kinase RdoA (MazF antagonist)
MTSEQAGATLASLALAVHRTPPPAELVSLRDYMDGNLRIAGDAIPASIASGVMALIERLPPEGGLCHCDLHPSNVVMTAQGPRLVDWTGAVRAPADHDLAISHLLLSEIIPDLVDDPERPRAIDAAMQSEYARLAGTSPTALKAASAPYLPIARVLALLAGGVPTQRERLIERVEAAFRSADSAGGAPV